MLTEKEENQILRSKIMSLNSRNLRIQFFRPDEGMQVYHLSRALIMELAYEANALYKVGRCAVIDKELFEKNLEKYKVRKEGTDEQRNS